MHRLLQHLLYPRWRAQRAFSRSTRQNIEKAIGASEARHTGELRFVVEGGLDWPHLLRGTSARQRAIELFASLGIWDTAQNSGVLIYVQLAERRVEIVADRGIHACVGDAAWQAICRDMEKAFATGNFEAGALAGITAIGELLTAHFPAEAGNPDELPNKPEIL